MINRDEYIQVVAMNNGSGIATNPCWAVPSMPSPWASATATAKHGSYDLGITPFTTAGRTRPDLVAPADATSYATPMVSAAAALLVEVGHASGTTLSTDPAVKYTYNRN